MSLDFLDDKDIYKLTRRRKWNAQFKMLRKLGYTVRLDGDGRPLVLRAHVEAKFGLSSSSQKKKVSPNWDALDATKAAH